MYQRATLEKLVTQASWEYRSCFELKFRGTEGVNELVGVAGKSKPLRSQLYIVCFSLNSNKTLASTDIWLMAVRIALSWLRPCFGLENADLSIQESAFQI